MSSLTTFWVDADGKRWRPEDMEPSHRRNALAFAERNALNLYKSYLFNGLMSIPDTDAGSTDMNEEIDRIENADYTEARTWLDQRPVIQQMRILVAEDRAVETIAAGRLRDDQRRLHRGWWEED